MVHHPFLLVNPLDEFAHDPVELSQALCTALRLLVTGQKILLCHQLHQSFVHPHVLRHTEM